eukprot:1161854-Pelagomonas_calceolata.AAC.12
MHREDAQRRGCAGDPCVPACVLLHNCGLASCSPAQALSDLSVLSHTEATNTAMTTLMGRSTAKYCGYADPDEPEVCKAEKKERNV